MKKLLKGGIAAAIACSALVGTVNPVSAKTVDTSLQTGIKEAAEGIEPRFMYTVEDTVSSWDFDTIVTYDITESTQTSSGWRIVGFQRLNIISKGLDVVSCKYTYKYYDNYQGLEFNIEYTYISAGMSFTNNKTVRVHV